MQLSRILTLGMPLIFSLVEPALAENIAEQKRTYCGSGWTESIVPDKFAGCELTEACRLHDICYGRCDPDGDLYGSAYCELSEQSEARKMSKQQCDQRLHDDIAAQNKSNRVCSGIGSFYQYVVKKVGQGPFNGREQLPLYLQVYDSSGSAIEANRKFDAIVTMKQRGLLESEKEIRVEDKQIIVPLNRSIESPLSRGTRSLTLPQDINDSQIRQLQTAPAH